jgi:hypothetical protein
MNFNEYYQYYLSLHQNKWCRRLHIVGQMTTMAVFITAVVLSFHSLWFLFLFLLLPFTVYPFAWSGHFFFEHNEPAAFKNPLWAKACDWRMLWDIIRGKIPL